MLGDDSSSVKKNDRRPKRRSVDGMSMAIAFLTVRVLAAAFDGT